MGSCTLGCYGCSYMGVAECRSTYNQHKAAHYSTPNLVPRGQLIAINVIGSVWLAGTEVGP
jgi:hypothetical protein